MLTQRLFRVLVIMALTSYVFACNRSPGHQLFGAWTQEGGADAVTFNADGKFSGTMAYGSSGGLRQLTGTYFVNADSMSITLDGDSPMAWKFALSGGELVVTYQQGGAVKMDGSMAKFKPAK